MKNIAVVTGSRSDYGLLKNTMKAITLDNELSLKLIVTGTHLSTKYGMTVDEIIGDKFNIDEICPILIDEYGKDKNAIEISNAIIAFSKSFLRLNPDILLILGDRYEAFAAAITATTMNIPIAHISGGETTEGAMDNQIRNSITKLSHIHFPGAEIYADKIISMGEEKWRVFNVGDPGIENIKKTTFIPLPQLEKALNMNIDENTILLTYHPVTLELDRLDYQIENLIKAIEYLPNNIIITLPNSDNGGHMIIDAFEKLARNKDNIFIFKSLGSIRYLSVMKYCGLILGNSSSGIVEAPFFKKPVVNIGNRQKGRLMAKNIISTSYYYEDIYAGIVKALSKEFLELCNNTVSLYGDGNTSSSIVTTIKTMTLDKKLLSKK